MNTLKDLGNNRWLLPNGEVLGRTHGIEACEGWSCVLHNPTNHKMSGWPLRWDWECKLFYRYCSQHAEWLVDPDQYLFLKMVGGADFLIPACCGYVYTEAGPQVQCGHCANVVQSLNRHDYQTCGCGSTSVDGGGFYTRIMGDSWGIIEGSTTEDVS